MFRTRRTSRLRTRCRPGVTLLEVMLASAMMATVVTAVSVLIRGSYSAWQAHESDSARIEAAHAVVRHLVRNLRQADGVIAITPKTDTAGSISLSVSTSGTAETWVWARNAGTDQVLFGVTAATDLLAEYITELTFTGYEADGTTETSDPAEIHQVKCSATIELDHDAGGTRTISSLAWIRSW